MLDSDKDFLSKIQTPTIDKEEWKEMLKKYRSFFEYDEFVKSMKVYPEKHKIVYPTLGMMGEASECSEKVKKWLRGDNNGVLNKLELAKEIGDVLWYLSSLADDIGYSLSEIAEMNINKLNKRKENGTIKGAGDSR